MDRRYSRSECSFLDFWMECTKPNQVGATTFRLHNFGSCAAEPHQITNLQQPAKEARHQAGKRLDIRRGKVEVALSVDAFERDLTLYQEGA